MPAKTATILAIILLTAILSCSKDGEDKGELLLGGWRIKSQVDILGSTRTYHEYDETNPKWLTFYPDGRVMSNGIVTTTWTFQPVMNAASYYLKNDIIYIGDSSIVNGNLYYINFPMYLKINFISKDLLVVQHIYRIPDPAQPMTVDSLVR